MMLTLLLSLSALAIELDTGSCDAAKLAHARDSAMAASPAGRAAALVDGVKAACRVDADTATALDGWSGAAALDVAALGKGLCPSQPALLSDAITGSYAERMDAVNRVCGLKRDGLLKKRELVRTAGPASAALGSHLYERWTSRGLDEEVAADLGRIVAGIVPIERGLLGDVAGRVIGAALPQSGGQGVRPSSACAPVIVVDVGAYRFEGEGVVAGTPEQRDALRALPGLEAALAEWTAPDGCPSLDHVLVAADAAATYEALLLAVETVQSGGKRARLLLAEAPDISMSGQSRKRTEGLATKEWPVDLGVSPDVNASSRIGAPPLLRFTAGGIDFGAPDLQPARIGCAGTKAVVCATGDATDAGSYAWTPMLRAAGSLRTARGVGAIDSVVVKADGDVAVGVVVKALDAWAWALREEGQAQMAPPPIVLADPDRPELSAFDGTNFLSPNRVEMGGPRPVFEVPD